ncbi:2'-5' RNA ligase family protein [Lysobacter cavernae]|uniref:2'-5' RNA ligase family protein n=1 Tax=Lysobacter cavernae TaxID=1685901 RepID=A0ABV7RPG2_9GAMM
MNVEPAITLTTPHEDRDFSEWHGGIAQYAFWAVPVDGPAWHALFEAARVHVAPFVHDNYRRAPHITLAAAGLLDERDAAPARLQRQAAALRQARIAAFDLHAGPMDSFTSSPYVAIEDPMGALHAIREVLASVSAEDSPSRYRPHLTVGLYAAAYEFKSVMRLVQAFEHRDLPPLRVDEVMLCAYATHDIQGPYAVLERVALTPPCATAMSSRR